MSASNRSGDCLKGVGCEAVNCRFNEKGCRCTADGIRVESPSASRSGETFCATFSPKASL